jgi:hypothetical protein
VGRHGSLGEFAQEKIGEFRKRQELSSLADRRRLVGEFRPKRVHDTPRMDEPVVFAGSPEQQFVVLLAGEARPIGGAISIGDGEGSHIGRVGARREKSCVAQFKAKGNGHGNKVRA